MSTEYFDVGLVFDTDWRDQIAHGAIVMANRFLRWDKSNATDVVGYRIRAKKDADPADTDSFYEVGNVDFVDLTLVPFLQDADGTYHFSVKAVDDVSLESAHARVVGPLDFVPPDAPRNVRLTES